MDDDETNNWALEKIMMPDAWDYTRGSAAITVGIIDSGIDASHPDLDEQVNVNLSRAFFGTTGPLVDENGHGTAIAGIIGAEANNQGDASIRAIPVYTCSRCGYVSYTTPPDY